MTDLAKLVVQMEANNAKLLNKLEQSEKRVKRFGSRSNKVFSQMANQAKVAGALIGGAFIFGLGRAASNLDNIAKTAGRVGFTTNALQELRFAADQTGVKTNTLDMAMQRFSRRLGEAKQGQGELRGVLDQYGISVVDVNGKMRSNEAVLEDVADAIAGAESEQEKLRIAFKAFDSEGAALVNTLSKGSAGLRELRAEARQTNQVVGGDAIAKAVAYQDAIGKLRGTVRSFVQNASGPLLESITSVVEKMNDWAKESGNVEQAARKLDSVFKVFASGGAVISTVFSVAVKKLGGIAAAIAAALDGDFRRAYRVVSDVTTDIGDEIGKSVDRINSIWSDAGKDIKQDATKNAEAIASPVTMAGEAIEKAGTKTKQQIDSIKQAVKSAADELKSVTDEFQGRLDALSAPDAKADEDLTVVDLDAGLRGAQKSLRDGDFDGAVEKARKAFDIVDRMKDAGVESELILQHFGNKLAEVAQQAQTDKLADITAQLDIDKAGAVRNALDANAAMQAALDQKPLAQVVNISTQGGIAAAANDTPSGISAGVPASVTAPARDTRANLTPVNINMPDGRTVPMYGDPNKITEFQRDLEIEALRAGRR